MNRTGSKILHGMLLATSAMVGSSVIVSTAAMANPAGGSVAVGSASITNPSATRTVINQASQKALINWNSFNIASGESVTFNQPNAKSLTVNRVTGPGSSTIDGALFANGNIWLLNANGILFGKGSQVNVGSLLATTSELSDADFKAGNNNFTPSSNPNATVVNQGSITVSRGGSVVLSAPSVSNEGLIQADLGTVVLGGAQAFTVDMTGDNLLRYQIGTPVSQTPTDASGKPQSALVSNSGTISATGGHVVMTARAAQSVQDNVINNTGIVEATSVSAHDGEIDLDAGPNGTANVGGTLDASGNGSGQTGGTVTVTGGTVNVAGDAKIDASGAAGGGTVLIGGGPHGTGTLAHATRTVIGAGATITADATTKGDGGNVTVWSDGTTQFNGSISAKGGAKGGNGGQVETSGHKVTLGTAAKVDTTAPLGLTGDWLLDPTDVLITNCQSQSSCSASGVTCIAPSTITDALVNSCFTETATNTLTVDTGSNITYSSSHELALDAGTGMVINSLIQNCGTGLVSLTSGSVSTGSLTLNAGVTASSLTLSANGAITQGSTGLLVGTLNANATGGIILTASGNEISGAIVLHSGANADITNTETTLVGNITAVGNIDVEVNNDNQGSGNATLILNGIVDAGGNAILHAPGDIISDPLPNPFAAPNNTTNQPVVDTTITANALTLVSVDGSVGGALPAGDGSGYLLGTSANSIHAVTGATGGVNISNNKSFTIGIAGDGTGISAGTSGGYIGAAVGTMTQLSGADGAIVGSNLAFGATSGYTLNNTGNEVGGDLTLYAGQGQSNSFTNTGYTIIGRIAEDLVDTTTVGGNITLTVLDGSLSQSGAIYADNLAVSVTGTDEDDLPNSITLTNTANKITGTFSAIGSGEIAFTNNGTITLGEVNGGWNGSAIARAGDITITALNGGINIDGNVVSGPAFDGDDESYTITLNASGNITQAHNDDLDGENFTVTSGVGNITLLNDNDFDGTINITAGGNAALGNNDNTWLGATSVSGNLTVLSEANITALANIQNPGYGNITLVAGWDGHTGVDVATNGTQSFNITEIATTSGAYGNIGDSEDSGNVLIGSAESDGDVSVGSLHGTTSIYGQDVTVDGSNGYAQIGYAGGGNGTINVQALGKVWLYTSFPECEEECGSGEAFIGNGGANTTTDTVGGNITVHAGGNVVVEANGGPAEIGNQGDGSTVNGTINITAAGSVSVLGENGYAQIGSSAYGTGTVLSGNIYVTAGDGIYLGVYDGNAQIGGYGEGGHETISGDIFVTANGADGISLYGEGTNSFVQIGNYGAGANTTVAGNVTVTANAGGIVLAGLGEDSSEQIGNYIIGPNTTVAGNILVVANGTLFDGNISVGVSGEGEGSRAQIGNYGTAAMAEPTIGGDITVQANGGDLFLQAGNTYAIAQIGNGGQAGGGTTSGNISVYSAGNITLNAFSDETVARIGNGYPGNFGNITGNINVTAVGAITLDSNTDEYEDEGDGTAYTLIGNGDPTGIAMGSVSGDISIHAGGVLYLQPTNGQVWIGNIAGADTEDGDIQSGNVTIISSDISDGDSGLTADIVSADLGTSANTGGNVFIGHTSPSSNLTLAGLDYNSPHNFTLASNGSINVSGVVRNSGSGAIELVAGWNDVTTDPAVLMNPTFNGGGGSLVLGANVTAATLNLAAQGNITQTGDLTVSQLDATAGRNIVFTTTDNAVAGAILNAVGSATLYDRGNLSVSGASAGGNLTLLTTGNLTVTGAAQSHNGTLAVAGWDGVTTSASSLASTASTYGNNGGSVLIAGTGTSGASLGSLNGKTLVEGYNVTLQGDAGHAQIGHAGGGATATIAVNAKGNVTLAGNTGGSYGVSYVQIGNGGSQYGGVSGGNISVIAGNNVTLTAGVGTFEYATIGNGGDTNSANASGAVYVSAGNSIALTGGRDYAQIGNGGYGINGAIGDITVHAAHNINLTSSVDGAWGYAQIGDGGFTGTGTIGGDINLSAGGNVSLSAGPGGQYAQIGNGVDPINGQASTVSGNIGLTVGGNLSLNGMPADSGGNTSDDQLAQIGNLGNGATSGDISIDVTGTTTLSDAANGGNIWIGNYATNGGTESGAVTFISGDFVSDNDDNDDVKSFVTADLGGGNFTFGVTDANGENQLGELLYSSSYDLTLLTAGDLEIKGDIQNSGSGNITVVTGWNPAVAPADVATTAGAYGNNNATLLIGGPDAQYSASLGSAQGTTSVYTDHLVVDGLGGSAQLGFNGTGTGAIDVNALADVVVETGGSELAQIGNGGLNATGAIGGDITLNTGDLVVSANAALSMAAIGNVGGANSTQSGNITINATHSVTLLAQALNTTAQIGNEEIAISDPGQYGDVSGNITVNTGELNLTANGPFSSAVIGFGDGRSYNNNVSGNVTVTATDVSLSTTGVAGADSNSDSDSEARIGNHARGNANGTVTVNATGNITTTAGDAGHVLIGAQSATGDTATVVSAGGGLDLDAAGVRSVAIVGQQGRLGTADITANALSVTGTGAAGGASVQIALTGAGQSVGSAANPLLVDTNSLSIQTSNGSAYLSAPFHGLSFGVGSSGVDLGSGSLVVTANGSVTQTDAIDATSANITASNGSIALTNGGNDIADASLDASGDAALYDTATLTVDSASAGGNLKLLSKGNLDFVSSVQLTGGSLEAVAGWDGTTTGAGAAQGSAYGNNGGSITIGGAGNVAVGSKSGTTTLAADDVVLSAINGYAQVGYHGGGSGDIVVNATGDVTLNGGSGTAYFAQIGDGGYQVAGNNSGAVTVLANGNVSLNAGSGQEAYAQIGNGGAESNSNTSGYTNTGAVSVDGASVLLGAGSGDASYAQIGDGGYKSGQGLSGTATIGGDITIAAVSGVTLNGNAADAYAQIGNGGDLINSNLGSGGGGTIGGNITVAVSDPPTAGNAITAIAGSGNNSYAQIGNGGNAENTGGSSVTFDIAGNITVDDLVLTGSNTGTDGYAMVGNGDGAGSGSGNVSGDITFSSGIQFIITPGTASGSGSAIGNDTGQGTTGGTITGYTPPPPPTPPNTTPTSDPTTAGSVSSIIQNNNTPTNFVLTNFDLGPDYFVADNVPTPEASGPTPLEKLAGDDGTEMASDDVAHSVGGGKTVTVTKTLIPGVLQEIVTLTPHNPHGVPPADQDYSSWGNEALWRW